MTDNHEPPSAVFTRTVRQLRQACGWSQAELGRRLGAAGHPLKQARISTIEQTGSVSIDQAGAFARAFGVPLETLLYEKPSGVPPKILVRHEQVARVIVAARTLQREVDRLATADQVRT